MTDEARNTIGNVLTIDGANVKAKMSRFIVGATADDGDKIFDFSRVIRVYDVDNEHECYDRWGVACNATGTSVIYKGEGNPPGDGNYIFFDTHDVPSIVIEEVSRLCPDLKIKHEWCCDQAYDSGYAVYENGIRKEGQYYDPRSNEAISVFFEVWGRYDEFKWDEAKQKYIHCDVVTGQPEME